MRLPVFCWGVGLVSAASLALSLLFTRIFSVTMYYHFAFMIVSLAMLGIAISGVAVYLLPRVFIDARKPWQAGLFAAAIVPAVVLALQTALENPMSVSLEGDNITRLVKLYVATALPFLVSGFSIALAISRAKERIGRVYASDLLGAGLGCVLMIPLIGSLGAPAAVLTAGTVAAVGGLLLALSCKPMTTSAAATAALALGATLYGAYETTSAATDPSRYRVAQGSKFLNESAVEFERWNAFSRITVSSGESDYKWLHIDADAATRMFSGSIAQNGYEAPKRFSEARVAGLVYGLRREGPALIIGPGGGSEVVSAVRAGVPRVVGAEVNPLIAQTIMQDEYASYNGNLYRNERVQVHIADGRSFVRRSSEAYSSIQATLVDTWAATAAGAFALSENNLYTADAFVDYLEHLQPQGVLSMTRWYSQPPTEFLRLLGLGRAALDELGVPEAEHAHHFFVAADNRMATMLLKRASFTPSEVETLTRASRESSLRVLYDPVTLQGEPALVEFFQSRPAEFYAQQDVDMAPSTDSRPFFFYTLRPAEFLTLLSDLDHMNRNNLGLVVLQVVLLVSIAFVLVLVVAPLFVLRRAALREHRADKTRLLIYFLLLGLAYILVELGLMQKFVLFLGHPVYALAVVIASLLMASGVGSWLSVLVSARFGVVGAIRRIGVILCGLLAVYAAGLSPAFNLLLTLPIEGRIAIAAVLVAALGVPMGMLLPLGVRIATRFGEDMVPWVFGLNGATSVVGSTLAVILSMHWGFGATLGAGILAYVAAVATARNAAPAASAEPETPFSSAQAA